MRSAASLMSSSALSAAFLILFPAAAADFLISSAGWIFSLRERNLPLRKPAPSLAFSAKLMSAASPAFFFSPSAAEESFFSRVPDGSLHGTGDGFPVGKPVSHGSQFFLHDAAGFPGCISHNLAYRFQMLRPAADAVLQTAEKAWRGFLS